MLGVLVASIAFFSVAAMRFIQHLEPREIILDGCGHGEEQPMMPPDEGRRQGEGRGDSRSAGEGMIGAGTKGGEHGRG